MSTSWLPWISAPCQFWSRRQREWTEGNPAANLIRFLIVGIGEVAPVTREVLCRAEPDRDRRPHVHVG
jgi:hypothetical protein